MNFYQTPSAGNTYLMFSYSKRAELYWRGVVEANIKAVQIHQLSKEHLRQ